MTARPGGGAADFLAAVYDRLAVADPAAGCHLVEQDGSLARMPYGELLAGAAWLAGQLPPAVRAGAGSLVLVAARHPQLALLAFFAALHTGAVPVVLPPPSALGGAEEFGERAAAVAARAPGPVLIAVEPGLLAPGELPARLPVVELPALDRFGAADPPPRRPGEVAFVQLTSASTTASKLVPVTHANVCANLGSLPGALRLGPDVRVGSWLPLYHDMGLVGTVLFSAFWGWPVHLLRPNDFILRPARWIDTLSRYRCTFTASPDFGYDYAARMVRDRDLSAVDLSELSHAVVGAEPVRYPSLAAFVGRFAAHGLRPESMVACYGMAETTVAATVGPAGRRPRYLAVDTGQVTVGKPVATLGEGVLGDPPSDGGVAVFSVGRPVAGLDLGLVDEDGLPVEGERMLGEVTVRGGSVCPGYLGGPGAGAGDGPGGAHRTGDLGFLDRGELFVVERVKHVIIRRGRNYLASLLEARVAAVLDRPANEVLVCDTDIHDPASRVVALVENAPPHLEVGPAQRRALLAVEVAVDEVLLCRRRVLPRTTSGKKRYHEARRLLRLGVLPITKVVALKGDPSR